MRLTTPFNNTQMAALDALLTHAIATGMMTLAVSGREAEGLDTQWVTLKYKWCGTWINLICFEHDPNSEVQANNN